MNFENFFESFKEEIDEQIDNGIISDKDKPDVLDSCAWTLLFNVATYKVVEKYNNEVEDVLRLIPEDNSGRKGGFADLTIFSEKEGNLIEIEHENSEKRLTKGYEKLLESDAKHKILIGYSTAKRTKSDILDELKQAKAKIEKKSPVHVLIAPQEMKSAKEYEHEEV